MERDYKHEAILLGYWGLAYAAGLALVNVPFGPAQVAGMVALAVANTQTGWLGHDYIHGTDKFSNTMRNFAALFAGMAPTWWSDKHNKHHALTNEAGVDEDIATDPFLFCWAPPEEQDNKVMRQLQPFLLPVWFSVLFWCVSGGRWWCCWCCRAIARSPHLCRSLSPGTGASTPSRWRGRTSAPPRSPSAAGSSSTRSRRSSPYTGSGAPCSSRCTSSRSTFSSPASSRPSL